MTTTPAAPPTTTTVTILAIAGRWQFASGTSEGTDIEYPGRQPALEIAADGIILLDGACNDIRLVPNPQPGTIYLMSDTTEAACGGTELTDLVLASALAAATDVEQSSNELAFTGPDVDIRFVAE